ncbi:MAG: Asp-tRNA(Asn)/Glu-tRNA(Gln) amidotransferase subunit GatB [bacterium]|nr:Asp-tRNA(Asn)/Glu-tRNA(Gln) amidotransferase subunit GatB [bacterium]
MQLSYEELQVKIGFEIHIPLKTKRKLFCGCSAEYWKASSPNVNVCPVCTGMPGAKPWEVNKEAVVKAVAAALMLHCKLEPKFVFLRKHYDYPDLPSGYQRTGTPLGRNGELLGVRIREVHLEEDPGKYDPQGLVDYNRSGCPLAEVVTEPDIRSPEHARQFLKELFRRLAYAGICIDKPGTVRFDINVSVLGKNRVEIKNVNSIKGAYNALVYEILRQKRLIEQGQEVRRETRAYLESQMITVPMRYKETEEDYRYIPDPDIPPIIITEEIVRAAEEYVREMPETAAARLKQQYGLPDEIIEKLIISKKNVQYFEELVQHFPEPLTAARWFVEHVYWQMNLHDLEADELKLTPRRLAQLLQLLKEGKISDYVAKELIKRLVLEDVEPIEIIKRESLEKQEEDVERIVREILAQHRKAVQDYKSGKKEAINFLVGQVMKATRGRIDPRTARQLLEKFLNEQ